MFNFLKWVVIKNRAFLFTNVHFQKKWMYKLPWNTYYVYRLALIFHLRICIDAQFSIEILLMYAFQYLLVFLNDIIFPITYMLLNVCLGISLCLVLNVLFNIIFVMYYFFRITKRRADILNWGIFSVKYNTYHKYRLMRHL